MKTAEYIDDMTGMGVKSIAERLAPACIGCPLAKVFISEDRIDSSDCHLVKINIRCDKMGIHGNICPDGGDPRKKYATDIGMMRNLCDEQLATNVQLHYFMMPGTTTVEVSRLLKSDSYRDMIQRKFKKVKNDLDETLHIMNETIAYVSAHCTKTEPITWNGKEISNLSQAIGDVRSKHYEEYRSETSMRSSGICVATEYMKEHFEKEFQTPFGIFVDSPSEYEGVSFMGDEAMTKEEIDMPKAFKKLIEPEEVYDNWASFG